MSIAKDYNIPRDAKQQNLFVLYQYLTTESVAIKIIHGAVLIQLINDILILFSS
jgi:hypothetical protein